MLKRAFVLEASSAMLAFFCFIFGSLISLGAQPECARSAPEGLSTPTQFSGQFLSTGEQISSSADIVQDDPSQHRRPIIVRRADPSNSAVSKADPSAPKLDPNPSKFDPSIRDQITRKHSEQCKSHELSRRLEERRSALRMEQQGVPRNQKR